MKFIFFFPFFIFLQCASSNQSIYKTLAQDLSSGNSNKTIAVIPFEMNSKNSENLHISEKLTHELVKTGNYQIIERSKIDRVLKEQSLSQTGITADDSMKIGKILSAQGVVVGSVIEENQYTTIIARIVDTESGKIWSSSRVSFLSSGSKNNIHVSSSNSKNTNVDNTLKPISESVKQTGEVKEVKLIRNGEYGRFIGLLKNTSSTPLTGRKLYINLKDKKNDFLDTVLCFTEKYLEPNEEVPFSCVLGNFPENYLSYEIFFEPENHFYGNHISFKILSEKFKEDTGIMQSYSVTGILKNDTATTITYPKVILSLFDNNKKFIGSAIGFGNQKSLSSGESTSFKIVAYPYSLAGKPKSYKLQTQALPANRVQ